MEVTVYSLPNCGICQMIKTKMKQKNIPFIEKDFSEYPGKDSVDHAPVVIVKNNNQTMTLFSPVSMNDWISNYGT